MRLCEVLDDIPHNKVSVFEVLIWKLPYFHKLVLIYDSFFR
jgi:hypothetical protein